MKRNCAGVVVKCENYDPPKYLICRSTNLYHRGNEVWGFPKGGVEPGESEKEAAMRELEEEAGIKIIDEGKLVELCRYSIPKKNLIFFLVEVDDIEVEKCFCDSIVPEKKYPENDKFVLATKPEMFQYIKNHMKEVLNYLE